MRHHHFEFVPVGRQWGWTIADQWEPRIWWTAYLSKDGPKVLLSDGRDARDLRVDVTACVIRHAATENAQHESAGNPTCPSGRIAAIAEWDADEPTASLEVVVYISAEDFDRILASAQGAGPPNLTVGFGSEHIPFGDVSKELTGAITVDHSGVYRWNDVAEKEVIKIEEWEFRQSQLIAPVSAPGEDESPALLRGLGVTFAVVVNMVAIALAGAAYAAVDTKFEVIVVSLLLLIYVAIANDRFVLRQTLLRSELAAVSRYLELRATLGLPAEPYESQHVSKAYAKVEQPGATFYINIIGISILGLMAIYELIAVLW